jgi:hypothetical protein
MFTPNPWLVPGAPFEIVSSQALFPSSGPSRRMSGGFARNEAGRLLLTFIHASMPRGDRAAIMTSWSDDDGKTWTEPVALYARPGWDVYPMSAARPLGGNHHRLFVGRLKFAPALGGIQPFADWRTSYVDSFDGGETWTEESEEIKLFPWCTEVYGASNPHRLSDGRYMWGLSGTQRQDSDWRYAVSFTDAEGNGYAEPVVIAQGDGLGFPEGDIIRLADGRYMAVIREQIRKETVIAWSADEGRTWTEPVPTGFLGSNIKLHRLPNGEILCAYRDEDPARRGVSCSITSNDGTNWQFIGQLYDAPDDHPHVPGHLCGYPDFIEIGDREFLGILQTYEDADHEIGLHLFHLRGA